MSRRNFSVGGRIKEELRCDVYAFQENSLDNDANSATLSVAYIHKRRVRMISWKSTLLGLLGTAVLVSSTPAMSGKWTSALEDEKESRSTLLL